MPTSKHECPACGAAMFSRSYDGDPEHYCLALSCYFNENGIRGSMIPVLSSLFADRERAGYQRGLDAAASAVDRLRFY